MTYIFVCLSCGTEYRNERPRSECADCGSKRFDVIYSVGDIPRC